MGRLQPRLLLEIRQPTQHVRAADLDPALLFPGGERQLGRAAAEKMPLMLAGVARAAGGSGISALADGVYDLLIQQTDVRIDR